MQNRVVNGPTSSGPNPARTRKYKPEPGPNPKINLKPKSCPKKSESKVRSEKFSNIANLFLLFSCTLKTKSTSQARIKHDIFVNFRPKPGPNPNPTRKTRPDLQLWCSKQLNGGLLVVFWLHVNEELDSRQSFFFNITAGSFFYMSGKNKAIFDLSRG